MKDKSDLSWVKNILNSKNRLRELRFDDLWKIIEELVFIIERLKKRIDKKR